MRAAVRGLTAWVLASLCGCGHSPALVGMVRGPAGALAEAQVRILDAADQEVRQALTNSAGKFAVHGKLDPKPYTLEVRKSGFQTVRKTLALPLTEAVDLELSSQGTVRGTVRLKSGAVVPGAIVKFKKGTADAHEVRAGEDGVYTAAGLDPGEYAVQAIALEGTLVRSIPRLQVPGTELNVDLELELATVDVQDPQGDVARPLPPGGIEIPYPN